MLSNSLKCDVTDISSLSRMVFLSKALRYEGDHRATVADLTAAHRPSTVRQYESGWKKFQNFIRARKIGTITPDTLASFASFVFHSSPTVSPATVTNAMVAIRDPVWFAFGIEIDKRKWELLKASFFLQRPSKLSPPPSWSLQKVLDLLQTPRFQEAPSTEDLLLKASFLTALATGHRVSQLAALLRTPVFAKWGPDGSSSFVSCEE